VLGIRNQGVGRNRAQMYVSNNFKKYNIIFQ